MSVSERGESEIEGNGMGARGRESGRDGVIGKDSAGERGEKWLWWVGGGRKYQTSANIPSKTHYARIFLGGVRVEIPPCSQLCVSTPSVHACDGYSTKSGIVRPAPIPRPMTDKGRVQNQRGKIQNGITLENVFAGSAVQGRALFLALYY